MQPGLAARLARWARHQFPVALTFLMLLIGLLPLPIAGYSMAGPALVLISVYYWSVLRPDLMPLYAVFLIGLLRDLLLGMPLGATALVLLLVQAVVIGQRRFILGRPFWIFWLGFALTAPVALGVTWLLVMAVRGAYLPADGAMFQLFAALAAFPVIAWLLLRAQRGFLAAD